jgi:hypothetical protein
MAGLGILIAWSGYWIAYYGVTQIQGGNWGLLDLGLPGRWTAAVAATPKDSGGSSTTPTVTTNQSAPAGSTILVPNGSSNPDPVVATGPTTTPPNGAGYQGPGPV